MAKNYKIQDLVQDNYVKNKRKRGPIAFWKSLDTGDKVMICALVIISILFITGLICLIVAVITGGGAEASSEAAEVVNDAQTVSGDEEHHLSMAKYLPILLLPIFAFVVAAANS